MSKKYIRGNAGSGTGPDNWEHTPAPELRFSGLSWKVEVARNSIEQKRVVSSFITDLTELAIQQGVSIPPLWTLFIDPEIVAFKDRGRVRLRIGCYLEQGAKKISLDFHATPDDLDIFSSFLEYLEAEKNMLISWPEGYPKQAERGSKDLADYLAIAEKRALTESEKIDALGKLKDKHKIVADVIYHGGVLWDEFSNEARDRGLSDPGRPRGDLYKLLGINCTGHKAKYQQLYDILLNYHEYIFGDA